VQFAHAINASFFLFSFNNILRRGRLKVNISLLAGTESRTKSGIRLLVKAECLPKVRWYFWPKTKPKPKVDRIN